MTFDERLSDAKERVKEMDEVDGFANRTIGTIVAALEAGLRDLDHIDCAYDALAMLQDIHERVR